MFFRLRAAGFDQRRLPRFAAAANALRNFPSGRSHAGLISLSLMDFATCEAWGLGLPIGGHALNASFGTVGTSLGISMQR